MSIHNSPSPGIGEATLTFAMFDSLSVSVAYVDTDLVVRHCNGAAARHLGRTLDQIAGHVLEELVPHHPAIWHAIKHVLACGAPYEHTVWVTPPGIPEAVERGFHITYRAHHNVTGQILGCLVEAQDVTKHALEIRALENQVEELAIASETQSTMLQEYLRHAEQIVTSISDGLFIFDRDWRYTYVNPQALAIAEMPLEQMLGASMWDLFPEMVGTEFEQRFRHAMDCKVPDVLEHYYPPYDIWVEIRLYPIPNGLLEFVTDIGERKRAEQALRESEERYRVLVGATTQAVWEADGAGSIVVDSPSWRAYTGQTPEEWTGDGWANAVHPEDRAHALREWHHAVTTCAPINTEFRIHHRDGAWRWTNVRAIPLRGADGTVHKWLGMNLDVTDRKRAAETLEAYAAELEQLNETNRLLLREVNHRVKNNLTAILGLITIERNRLSRETQDSVPHDRCRAALGTLGERVRSLAAAHALLSVNNWRPLRLDALAGEVIAASTPPSPDLKLVIRIAPSSITVSPEQAHHLALVIGELTTNTVKYGDDRGRVDITLEMGDDDGEVWLVYRDRGAGYPGVVLMSDQRSVGLSLVHSIVTHSLRGSWSIRNDRGAVTEIRFPYVREDTSIKETIR